MDRDLIKRGIAECLGTFMLVFLAVGTAVVTNANVVATALAFGLVIVAMAYTIGRVSGCHINPAVSLGALMSKRMNVKEFLVYIGFQFLGATLGAALLYTIVRMTIPSSEIFVWGTNNVPLTTAGGYIGSFLLEIVLTFVFVYVILVVTDKKGNPKTAGLFIGLTLTLVHLIGIGFTGTSVNPARSFGPALMRIIFDPSNSAYPLAQIWVFILAPLIGALLATLIYKLFHTKKETVEMLDENITQ